MRSSGPTEEVRKFRFVFKMCLVVGILEGKYQKITFIYVRVACMRLKRFVRVSCFDNLQVSFFQIRLGRWKFRGHNYKKSITQTTAVGLFWGSPSNWLDAYRGTKL